MNPRRTTRAAVALAAAISLAACGSDATIQTPTDVETGDSAAAPPWGTAQGAGDGGTETATAATVDLDAAVTALQEQQVTAGPASETATRISLADGASQVQDPADSAQQSGADAVSISSADGADIVRISSGGTFDITGTLSDGQVLVDSGDEEVTLILNGADISSSTGAALVIEQSGRATVSLATDSVNRLSDAASYVYPDAETDEPNAALFSFDDLVLSGAGELLVIGNSNDGIASKDSLSIASGTISVAAVDDGIRGKEALSLIGGTVQVTAADDGLKADADDASAGVDSLGWITISGGSTTVTAVDDAVSAEGQIEINGGQLVVPASTEGIEAAQITISGGSIEVTSTDDAINAASDLVTDLSVTISGGSVLLDAEGDGIDSNGTLDITGGNITVHGPTGFDNGAVDADGVFTLSGGSLVAWASAGMMRAPDDSSSATAIAAMLTSTVPAATTVEVLDSGGATVATLQTAKESGSLLFSDSALTTGAQYTLVVDGQIIASATAGDYTTTSGPGGPPGGPADGSGPADNSGPAGGGGPGPRS